MRVALLLLVLALGCRERAASSDAPSVPSQSAARLERKPPPVEAAVAAAADKGDHLYEARDGSRVSAMLESPLGLHYPAEIDLPPKELAARPAALLVPSQVVGMRSQPTLDLAQELRAQRMAVMRFDWGWMFGGRRGPASTEPRDLTAEAGELEHAVSILSSQSHVDAKHVLLVGSGVGAVAAYALFARSEALHALVLLEPPCIDARGFGVRYPELAKMSRPILFASQRNAPACPGNVLERALRRAPANVEHVWFETREQEPAAVVAFWQRSQQVRGE